LLFTSTSPAFQNFVLLKSPIELVSFTTSESYFWMDKKIDTPNILIIADLTIDKERYILQRGGDKIEVTKKELKILWFLANHAGEAQSRQAIFQAAWNEDILVGSRTIDVHIRRLRAKLGGNYITTVKVLAINSTIINLYNPNLI